MEHSAGFDIQWRNNVTTTSITPADLHCNYYRKENVTVIIIGGYEGIPQNLIINVCVWMVLIILFSILRKKAWNYGRLGLLQHREQRVEHRGQSGYNVCTQLCYGGDEPSGQLERMNSLDSGSHFDHGLFSWIAAVFRIKDDQIRTRCGMDAVQYLHFQRHVMFIMAIITVLSLAVALPLNFQGTLEGDEKTFGHTTLSNLDPSSWYVWVHVTLGIILFPVATYMLRRFSVKLKIPEVETPVSRTLMISCIPRKHCSQAKLMDHFAEVYPDHEVVELQLAYNVKRLIELDRDRQYVTQARIYSENEARAGNRLLVRPYKCGNMCVCCDACGGSVIDAVEYYTDAERSLSAAVEIEKSNVQSGIPWHPSLFAVGFQLWSELRQDASHLRHDDYVLRLLPVDHPVWTRLHGAEASGGSLQHLLRLRPFTHQQEDSRYGHLLRNGCADNSAADALRLLPAALWTSRSHHLRLVRMLHLLFCLIGAGVLPGVQKIRTHFVLVLKKMGSERARAPNEAPNRSGSSVINGEQSADSSFLPAVLTTRAGSAGPLHRMEPLATGFSQLAENTSRQSGGEAVTEEPKRYSDASELSSSSENNTV